MLIRRRILLLAALISLALPATLQAQFTFVTNNGAITIKGYTGSDGSVVIPSMTNGWPVTGIANIAFWNNFIITNVTIPDSITTIGHDAFNGCGFLLNVTMGNSIASIGDDAFYNCINLRSITIPSTITSLGGGGVLCVP